MFWEETCRRNISTVVRDPISTCSGPNRKETQFSFREAFREAFIPLL